MSNILVVDDHAVVREPLVRLLRFEGYRTSCAGNGNEALSSLEADPADVVLLDLMMPKKDGVSFLQSLRKDARWKAMPVILMTGVLEGSLLEEARRLGISAELPKARFSVDDLFARLRECLAPKPPLLH